MFLAMKDTEELMGALLFLVAVLFIVGATMKYFKKEDK